MTNAIEIRDLCKSYPGFELDHVSFSLPSGCIFGLVGENGAGKSTTIRLLMGLLRRSSGEISILGNDPKDPDVSWKKDVGTVIDVLGLPSSLKAGQVEKIMKDAFPNWNSRIFAGYLSRLNIPTDKTFREMSSGNKMKLNLAVALSHDPKLLVLDEATNSLDPLARDEVNNILMEYTRDENHSVLISSHIVSDLEKICDYIAFLHKGKLLLCEEKDRLTSEYGVISCTRQDLDALDPDAVLHVSETPYGCRAAVKRDRVPNGFEMDPITIEELFILMAKEEK